MSQPPRVGISLFQWRQLLAKYSHSDTFQTSRTNLSISALNFASETSWLKKIDIPTPEMSVFIEKWNPDPRDITFRNPNPRGWGYHFLSLYFTFSQKQAFWYFRDVNNQFIDRGAQFCIRNCLVEKNWHSDPGDVSNVWFKSDVFHPPPGAGKGHH